MNIMNIPRFTAEASLYKTCGRYQSVAVRGCGIGGQRRVVSQIGVGSIGAGGSGRLNAWGCWESWCCDGGHEWRCVPGRVCEWVCKTGDYRGTRCIWPW